MSEAEAAALSRLERQVSQRLRTIAAATAQLREMRSRLGPLDDDVRRIIGGTAQGTDAEMVDSLGQARAHVERAIATCMTAQSARQLF